MPTEAPEPLEPAMPVVPIFWVDAFCDGPFSGNPAAVCLLDHPAGAAAMQSLAFEIGLSETAFVWPEDDGFGLRWFTPAAEVDLCGHATVATAHALAELGRLEGGRARLSTKSGWLEATVDNDEVEIDLPSDVPSPVDTPALLAEHWPVLRAATTRFDLLVELESEEAVRRVDPAAVELSSFPYRGIAVTARAGTRSKSTGPMARPTSGSGTGHGTGPVTGSVGAKPITCSGSSRHESGFSRTP